MLTFRDQFVTNSDKLDTISGLEFLSRVSEVIRIDDIVPRKD
jgi:hypothetical protein